MNLPICKKRIYFSPREIEFYLIVYLTIVTIGARRVIAIVGAYVMYDIGLFFFKICYYITNVTWNFYNISWNFRLDNVECRLRGISGQSGTSSVKFTWPKTMLHLRRWSNAYNKYNLKGWLMRYFRCEFVIAFGRRNFCWMQLKVGIYLGHNWVLLLHCVD